VSDQAVYQARQRLGWRPLWWLRRHALDWLADRRRDPTAFSRGRRLLAVDGTILTVADTPANTTTFGKSRNQYNRSGFPLMRLVALCEIGTRALVRWVARPYRVPEQKLLPRLLPHVPAGSLLVADRNFHSWAVWEYARTAGFALLLRVQSGLRLPVVERLADGSYLSRVCPRRGKHKTRRAIPVRVIECRIRVGTKTSTYRLLTSLLAPSDAPARELVDVYAKRWEVETAFAEFKGQLAERTTHLRAHHPRLVMAEVDALLIGYFAVRRVAIRAARAGPVDPLSVSFRQAVEAVVCALSSPRGSDATLFREVARRRTTRRTRSCPRVRKVVRCAWPVKKPGDHTFRYKNATITIQPPPLS
jgi:Transposase DDE domain